MKRSRTSNDDAVDTRVDRILADFGSPSAGPLVMFFAGIHGNEHAGVDALVRVSDTMRARGIEVRGHFLGVVGNTAALPRGVRYVDIDLNRAWTPQRIHALRTRAPENIEEQELQELLVLIDAQLETHPGVSYFIDLHTASAPGAPFATVGDTLRNRDFAAQLPVTKVLGIEEQIDGGMLEYMNNAGQVTLGFEAGQHEDPESVIRHEALVWLALETVGLLDRGDVPNRDAHVRVLEDGRRGLPTFLEVRYRHAIEPGDQFVMEPGWHHFQRAQKGELLAHDQTGEIRANESGYVLLPLYQGKGNDGFFLGREVRPFWLWVSRAMRTLRLPGIAHWLPGVRRKPDEPRTVVIDTRVARWQSTGVFHLLGFRRIRNHGPLREFSRRVE